MLGFVHGNEEGGLTGDNPAVKGYPVLARVNSVSDEGLLIVYLYPALNNDFVGFSPGDCPCRGDKSVDAHPGHRAIIIQENIL
jgi:hypothetical protein